MSPYFVQFKLYRFCTLCCSFSYSYFWQFPLVESAFLSKIHSSQKFMEGVFEAFGKFWEGACKKM
jgi:hypothetical protein